MITLYALKLTTVFSLPPLCSSHLPQPVSWWTAASLPWSAPSAACQRAASRLWPTPCTSPTSSSSARQQGRRDPPARWPAAYRGPMTTPWWSAHQSIWMRSLCRWCLSTAGRSSSSSTIPILVRTWSAQQHISRSEHLLGIPYSVDLDIWRYLALTWMIPLMVILLKLASVVYHLGKTLRWKQLCVEPRRIVHSVSPAMFHQVTLRFGDLYAYAERHGNRHTHPYVFFLFIFIPVTHRYAVSFCPAPSSDCLFDLSLSSRLTPTLDQ